MRFISYKIGYKEKNLKRSEMREIFLRGGKFSPEKLRGQSFYRRETRGVKKITEFLNAFRTGIRH